MNQEIFWNVISNYNQATLLIQVILSVILAVSFILEKMRRRYLPVQCVLGICNLYLGIVFEFIYGTSAIQRYFAAPLFIAIGVGMCLEGIRNRNQKKRVQTMGTKLLFVLTLLYPLISLLLGHRFPAMVLYMMPCPIACLSIIACSRYKRTNKVLMILLIIWGLTGVKSLLFDAMEDCILLLCGVYGIYYLFSMCHQRKIEGKTVFITGGSSGIGLELARRFAKKGNKVIVCGRDKKRLELVNSEYPSLETMQLDITDENVQESFAQVMEKIGGIDILINNAGIQRRYDWHDKFTQNAIDEINTNFLACVRLIDQFLEQPEKQGRMIVNLTSMLGVIPKKSAPTYGASKAAFHIFTKSLSYQLRDEKVQVVDILPPLVETNMSQVQSNQNRMSVTDCADEIMEGLELRRKVIRPGKAKLLLGLYRVIPQVFDKIMECK